MCNNNSGHSAAAPRTSGSCCPGLLRQGLPWLLCCWWFGFCQSKRMHAMQSSTNNCLFPGAASRCKFKKTWLSLALGNFACVSESSTIMSPFVCFDDGMPFRCCLLFVVCCQFQVKHQWVVIGLVLFQPSYCWGLADFGRSQNLPIFATMIVKNKQKQQQVSGTSRISGSRQHQKWLLILIKQQKKHGHRDRCVRQSWPSHPSFISNVSIVYGRRSTPHFQ